MKDSHPENLSQFNKYDSNGYKRRQNINLTINTKQIGCADQTPTPTKLLKKCDEVGLFKDLQVNPFDETFQKAVEGHHNREFQAEVALVNISDDTLHTPNVFPMGNEFLHCKDANENDKISKVSNVAEDFLKNKKCYIRSKKKKLQRVERSTQSENNYVVLDKNITFKLPIPKLPPSIKVVTANTFSVLLKNTLRVEQPNQRPIQTKRIDNCDKLNLLESNRLAQKRSREKRKIFYQELLQKNLELEERVASLVRENALLKRQIDQNNSCIRIQNKSQQKNINGSMEQEQNKSETVITQAPPQTLLANQEMLCLENCLPILETQVEEINTSSDKTSQVVLRKPFKKRCIHPKLYLSCKLVQDNQ